MKGPFLSAAVVVVILAVSPVEAAHAAARVPDSNAQAAGMKSQSFEVAQTGKALETAEPKQGRSAEPKAVKAKALRRAYAIHARIAKQKKQLAKSKKPPLKAKKKQTV